MQTLPKFKVNYIVLFDGANGPESTYFATHGLAFNYCEGLAATVKGVYVVKGTKPMTLGPVNVWGCHMFAGAACDIFQLQQTFSRPPHNVNFIVV